MAPPLVAMEVNVEGMVARKLCTDAPHDESVALVLPVMIGCQFFLMKAKSLSGCNLKAEALKPCSIY